MPESEFGHSNEDIMLSADNLPSETEKDKAAREEYKRWLIRQSSVIHNGHPFLEATEEVDKMNIEDIKKRLDEIKNENIAS